MGSLGAEEASVNPSPHPVKALSFHSLGHSSLQLHPLSPSLVNSVVTGSLRKSLQKFQIPQVSQIPILVPLPATLAGG